MPSMSECRLPYLLSNLLLVTESLTLIAGNSRRARLGELVQAVHAGGGLLGDALDAGGDAGPALRVGGERAAQQLEDDRVLLGVVLGGGGHGAGLLVLDALVDEQRDVAAVVEDHVRAADRRRRPARAPARCTTSTPRASRPSRRRPARPLGVVDGALGADGDRGRGVVLGGEDVAAGPAHLRRRARRASRSGPAVCTVMCSEPVIRAPVSGLLSPNSARSAIRPGISCSARRISWRPASARDRSATLKSVGHAEPLVGMRIEAGGGTPTAPRPARPLWARGITHAGTYDQYQRDASRPYSRSRAAVEARHRPLRPVSAARLTCERGTSLPPLGAGRPRGPRRRPPAGRHRRARSSRRASRRLASRFGRRHRRRPRRRRLRRAGRRRRRRRHRRPRRGRARRPAGRRRGAARRRRPGPAGACARPRRDHAGAPAPHARVLRRFVGAHGRRTR